MIEKVLSLLERFVAAHEEIAKAYQGAMILASNPAHAVDLDPGRTDCCGDNPCAGKTVVDGSTAPSEPVIGETPVDYSTWERDALLSECEKRGIEVPPRTRTTTMISQLEEFDAGWRPNTQTEPAPTQEEPVADPFATPQESPEQLADKFPSVEEARVVLRRLMAHHEGDSARVTELIKKHAGVEKIAMVPASKFQAIMDEAEAAMAEG